MRIKQIELNGFKSFMERTVLELPAGVNAVGRADGVGTKAYAIIEQGRVDQLINAKPEELRLFIEEAAGTTRFRSRKVAAERKMERTRENLLRVQDILRELERQSASLERQARRAEEYHRIKQELRELDLRVMAVRQRSWSAEVAALGERLAALQAEEAASAEAIRQRRGASDEAHAARATNEERLRAVEGELTAERLAAAEAQARSEGLAERGRELAARAAESRSEAERIAVRLAELARESAALRAESDRLVAERQTLGELQRTLGAEEMAQLAVLEQARAEATQLRSRADSLRELQARYEGCTRGVASLVGRAPGAALLASVLRVPKDLERAVAAALGTRLAQVVVPDTAAAIYAVDWLTRTSGGSGTHPARTAL